MAIAGLCDVGLTLSLQAEIHSITAAIEACTQVAAGRASPIARRLFESRKSGSSEQDANEDRTALCSLQGEGL
jgi:hypothetical protein